MENKKKLRREDSFLGIHFDFHACETDTQIGANTTREMIEEIIDKTGVDYIQTDCKGHAGFVSYPSKLGNSSPGIVKDGLRIWREVTEEKGVGLYMHYSGVWDTNAICNHPEYARVDENGEIDKNNISFFSDYADKLFIPQIIELCDEYNVDGMWIDGDCWAACQDYSDKAIETFKKETGVENVPKTTGEPYFYEFLQFTRENYRKYLSHYVDTIHNHNKNFQICSNWAFTSYMPEKVSMDVDFISGDYPLSNSVNVARFEARCMLNQGKAWDLMAWGFSGQFGKSVYSTKTAIQLKQEAAIVLALGGGFQVYFTQKRDGSIRKYQLDIMGEVAKFCRERQSFCHKAMPIAQIALLHSGYNFYKRNQRLFSAWDNIIDDIKGVLECLCDGQKCTEIIMEHHELDKFPCVIIPEWECLEESYIKKVLNYVENGGRLLVIGKTVELFKDYLGVEFVNFERIEEKYYLKYHNFVCGIEAPHYTVVPKTGTEMFGEIICENDYELTGTSASTVCNFGKGKIGAIYFGYGDQYLNGRLSLFRDFLSDMVDKIFTEHIVTVRGTHNIDVTLMEKEGQMIVNLVNIGGPHGDDTVFVFDEIPPTGPFTVNIKTNKLIKKVILEPEGKELHFTEDSGGILVEIDNIAIHNILILG